MKNIDKDIVGDLHMFIALRRRKDNPEGKELCFRQICIDHDTDLECIRARVRNHEGNWRIHKTINKRSTEAAMKLLMINLINDPSKHTRLMSEYKTALMRRESKAERNILLDIDGDSADDLKSEVSCIFVKNGIPHSNYKTPNGWHIVAEKFDTRLVEEVDDIDVKRDAYYFIEKNIIL